MLSLVEIIKKTRYFAFFLLLEFISLKSFMRFQKSYEAFLLDNIMNFNSYINEQVNDISDYFNLKEKNDKLSLENAYLRNQLPNVYTPIINSELTQWDTLRDENNVLKLRQYKLLEAKVINNAFLFNANNFFQIHRGSWYGIKPNMGVTSQDGIVGVVVNTTSHFANVLSILNMSSKVSATIAHTKFIGYVEWDGKNKYEMVMKNYPLESKINIGDSVVTSQYSTTFLEHSFIGTISDIIKENNKNSYTIRIKLGANFDKLDRVYVIENTLSKELETLYANSKNLNFSNEK